MASVEAHLPGCGAGPGGPPTSWCPPFSGANAAEAQHHNPTQPRLLRIFPLFFLSFFLSFHSSSLASLFFSFLFPPSSLSSLFHPSFSFLLLLFPPCFILLSFHSSSLASLFFSFLFPPSSLSSLFHPSFSFLLLLFPPCFILLSFHSSSLASLFFSFLFPPSSLSSLFFSFLFPPSSLSSLFHPSFSFLLCLLPSFLSILLPYLLCPPSIHVHLQHYHLPSSVCSYSVFRRSRPNPGTRKESDSADHPRNTNITIFYKSLMHSVVTTAATRAFGELPAAASCSRRAA